MTAAREERAAYRAATSAPYRLVRPCSNCPFRLDVPPYLRPERATEIARSVAGGAEFYCHKTTKLVEDDDGNAEMEIAANSQVCAGSLILMAKAGGENQMARIATRLGLLDLDLLDMDAPVPSSWAEWQERFVEEEGETCAIVGPGCEAPAGYLESGSVIAGTDYVDTRCSCCGEPVCEACLDGHDECPYCREGGNCG